MYILSIFYSEYPFNTAHFLFAVINHSISTEHPVGNVYHPIIKSGKYGMENLYLFYCTTYSRSIYIIAYFKRFKNKYNQTTCEIGKIAGKCHTYSHTG